MAEITPSICRFFEIDLRPLGEELMLFHPGLNEFDQPVVWGGRSYQPLPIHIGEIEYDGKGRQPRPTLVIADLTGRIGVLAKAYDDLNGIVVTVRETSGKYLDAVNFVDGNPLANPLFEYPSESYLIDRKAEDYPGEHLAFELCAATDTTNVQIPLNNYNATICTLPYRGELCGYSGAAMFDLADKPTTDPTKDRCGRRISSCECRFGKGCELRCRIFPGVQLIMQG